MSYISMTKEQLQAEYNAVFAHFTSCKEKNLKLNMKMVRLWNHIAIVTMVVAADS